MATRQDVDRIMGELPEVAEGEHHGHVTWSVRGKGIAWLRSFSKADLKRFGDAPIPSLPIVAVRVDDLGEKEAVLALGHKGVFTIPHFDGYAAVLIELRMVAMRPLRTTIVDGWAACAPAPLVDEHRRTRRRR
jgi:hypothetical protein